MAEAEAAVADLSASTGSTAWPARASRSLRAPSRAGLDANANTNANAKADAGPMMLVVDALDACQVIT